MQEALYHPDFGYYTAHIDALGPRGDFATTATLTPLLAQSLGTFIQNNGGAGTRPRNPNPPKNLLGQQPPPSNTVRQERTQSARANSASGCSVTLLEIGPGSGALARDLLANLPWRLRRKTHLHLIEISPRLQSLQKQTLKKYQKQITWHTDITHALAAVAHPTQLVILSNELVDAFPASVCEFDPDNNTWQKLHLAFTPDKGIKERLLPCPPPTKYSIPKTLNSRQRIEVHESYHDWQTSWVPRPGAEGASECNDATLLTIDYGDTIDHLYHRRPQGTLRAYYRHQRFAGPDLYARFGKQDLTADVNFSALIDHGNELGLETVSLQTQREFILTQLPNTPPDHPLIDPHGPGTAFKVLHQKPKPAPS
ncbi:MAG: SAM-dependent methyltransferase [Verrucomicrobiota bacterium]